MHAQYNGGISLAVGVTIRETETRTEIRAVTSYQPSYEPVSESFEEHDCRTYSIYKGSRFSAQITTGIMDAAEMAALKSALLYHEFKLYCPEYPSGIDVYLTSLSQPLEVANYGRKVYRISFAVAAVALVNGGSL